MNTEDVMAKIAIVDDSRLARTFTVSCLKKLVHNLMEVDPTSVFDTLKTLREDAPDLILMDYLMPNCPGASLVRACKEDPILQNVRILVITAHHDEDVLERLNRLGVDQVFHKPFDAKALVDAVETLLVPEG
jgi:CheY-like chemotaxis protein